MARIQLLQRQGYQWVVDADIQSFFDSIDHTLLMMEVSKHITDTGLAKLKEHGVQTLASNLKRDTFTDNIPLRDVICPSLSWWPIKVTLGIRYADLTFNHAE